MTPMLSNTYFAKTSGFFKQQKDKEKKKVVENSVETGFSLQQKYFIKELMKEEIQEEN